jgi:uncharacterized repeat protein (TIGR02543 family)
MLDPSRIGYVFTGWYKEPQCVNVWDFSTAQIEEDTMIYAGWKTMPSTLEAYAVHLDPNGGQGTMPSAQAVRGSAFTIPSNLFTNRGHHFAGWNTRPDGSGTAYTDMHRFLPFDRSSSLTLYAQWEANAYMLRYDSNGGLPPSVPTRSAIFGEPYGSHATALRSGYSLAGWFTQPEGGQRITEDSLFLLVGDQTLYAHWVINSQRFTIRFVDWNGRLLKAQKVPGGGNAKPPENPIRKGYSFYRWAGKYTDVWKNTVVTAVYHKQKQAVGGVAVFDGGNPPEDRTDVAPGVSGANEDATSATSSGSETDQDASFAASETEGSETEGSETDEDASFAGSETDEDASFAEDYASDGVGDDAGGGQTVQIDSPMQPPPAENLMQSILSGNVPLASLSHEGGWSLFSLFLFIVSIVITFVRFVDLLVAALRRKTAIMQDDPDGSFRRRRRNMWFASTMLGLFPAIFFLVMDHLGEGAVWFNSHSPIVLAAFVTAMAAAWFSEAMAKYRITGQSQQA